MARIHEIGIGADTRAFEDNVRSGVINPVEDAADAMDRLGDAVGDAGQASGKAGGDVSAFAAKLVDASRKAGKSDEDIKSALRDMGLNAKQAERAVERIGDEFKESGRDGERAIDKLEDSLKDAQRETKKLADDADDVGDRGKKGLGKLSDGAQEVVSEVGQNLSEAVSSVRDNLADLGQVGQDTLGGLAGTLAGSGPAGIVGAAGLAAGAVGLGLVTAELQKQQEAADRMRERIGAAYEGAAQDGRLFIDEQTKIADAMDLIFNTDRADEYKRVLADATQLGLDRSTVIAANTGDLEAQQAVQQQINRLLEDSNSYELTGTTNKKTLKSDVADIRDRWREVVTTTQEYADKTATATDYSSKVLLGLIESAGTAKEEVDELGNRLLTLPDGQKVLIDADTGQATANVDKFRGDVDGVVADVNGKEIVLQARTAIDQAQRDLDGFFIRNNGKTITYKGKVITPDGEWQ
ncbi:hypothetical protein [Microbacterium hydrocarbonoxydans]|uniref:hypothetical protein n=1 Tax=Microbacterium hydrocarbonoxydans TaxID=273678 RepID=UPI00204087AE|nr:hypothetical protein [Microbacterium hydrocarbonoxydans]MCM3779862.1 hypothetical protein [Microbacterium hydrocarbonoxydans]